jgi:hypothetical protein
MSDVTTEPDRSSMSATEQVKERVGEGAQQIQEKASDTKAQTGGRLRKHIDTRSTETGNQMTATASALRRTAKQLRGDQHEPQARVLEQIADRAERLGRYLTDADADRLLRDVERNGRRRPWLVAGGSLVLGFLAARFTKASSNRRYDAEGGGDNALAATEQHSAPSPSGTAAGGRGGGDGGDL